MELSTASSRVTTSRAADGADVTTSFDYDVPFKLGGRAVDRLVLEKRMRRDFEDSMDNLRLLAETSAVPAAIATA